VYDVVVDGLGHADHGQRIATIPGRGLNLPTGLHRAIAAVVEEETNVVGRQHRKQAVVLGRIALFRVEIETAGPNAPPGVQRKRARSSAEISAVSTKASRSTPRMPLRAASTLPMRPPASRAVAITPAAEALITAVTPPDWAYRRFLAIT
jgi:hypothetical protein